MLLSSVVLGQSVRTQHGARHRRLEQVKAEERVELARELHDTVAHHVSAIAIQAQAGRALAATSPGSSLEALEVIEVEASRTLAEMRAMVRVLRSGTPADYAPQPGAADVGRLIGASPADAHGCRWSSPVTSRVCRRRSTRLCSGSPRRPSPTPGAMPAMPRWSTYESTADASFVRLHVDDDGDPALAQTAPESGFGLIGMVERATLLGGTCRAGPRLGRGWTVDATLPRTVTP